MKKKRKLEIENLYKRIRALHERREENDVMWLFYSLWESLTETDELIAKHLPGLSEDERRDMIAKNQSARELCEYLRETLGDKPPWYPGSRKKET